MDPLGLSVEEKGAFSKFWNKTKYFFKNTFGAGVVQAQTYKTIEIETLFAGFETGESTTKVIAGDISKPISIYAQNASEWWKIWEYTVGVQINIGNGGFSLSGGLLDSSLSISAGNETVEITKGLNKLSYTTHHDVDFGKRTAGTYEQYYIRTIPTAVATAIAVTGIGLIAEALGSAIATLIGLLGTVGTMATV